MEFSYWERASFLGNTKYCVLGAGIVGLSTAFHLAKKLPGKDILVVEKSPFSGGGSTKNAGFACFGSPTEVLSDLELMGEAACTELIQLRYQGLQLLRETLGDENIEYSACGGLELFSQVDKIKSKRNYETVLEALPKLNNFMLNALDEHHIYEALDDPAGVYGLKSIEGGINNRLEGSINTGKMMRSLIKKVEDAGVRIVRGMELLSFEDKSEGVHLHFDFGKLNCDKLFICTNSMSRSILPDADIMPGRNMVMVTSPISELKLKGTFHMSEGYLYFRNIGDRLLIGGGRHWAGEEENTLEHGSNPNIKKNLIELLEKQLLVDIPFQIEHEWSGFLGLGKSKMPILKKVSKNTYCEIRMGGMGVAIGSEIGKQLSALFLKE